MGETTRHDVWQPGDSYETYMGRWSRRPFTLGNGPAPGYCASLAPAARQRLRDKLAATAPSP